MGNRNVFKFGFDLLEYLFHFAMLILFSLPDVKYVVLGIAGNQMEMDVVDKLACRPKIILS